MIVPEGKTLYTGNRKFNPGETVPPGLEDIARANLEKAPLPEPEPEPDLESLLEE